MTFFYFQNLKVLIWSSLQTIVSANSQCLRCIPKSACRPYFINWFRDNNCLFRSTENTLQGYVRFTFKWNAFEMSYNTLFFFLFCERRQGSCWIIFSVISEMFQTCLKHLVIFKSNIWSCYRRYIVRLKSVRRNYIVIVNRFSLQFCKPYTSHRTQYCIVPSINTYKSACLS